MTTRNTSQRQPGELSRPRIAWRATLESLATMENPANDVYSILVTFEQWKGGTHANSRRVTWNARLAVAREFAETLLATVVEAETERDYWLSANTTPQQWQNRPAADSAPTNWYTIITFGKDREILDSVTCHLNPGISLRTILRDIAQEWETGDGTNDVMGWIVTEGLISFGPDDPRSQTTHIIARHEID